VNGPERPVRAADWYFDFVSPFAYLQSERLATLAPLLRVRYRPVLFAALLDAHGQKGPAEIPAKRVFTYRHVVWLAKRAGIPLKFPHEHPFNPLPLLRLAIACDCAPDAVHRIFRFVWRDGRLPDLPIEWHELTHDLGLPDADARIATTDVKDALRRHTDEALARGVFGVPTLAIGDALFWGADATEMARDYAAAGGRFDDPEYERVATLPEGATRRKARPEPARKPRTRVIGTAR
jgi:2-hydroxychromene-2-carboxylate isomerase